MTNYLTDEQLRDEVVRSLDGDSISGCRYVGPAPCQCCHYGVKFGNDGIIYIAPGWYTVWYSKTNILGLDLLWDMPDDVLNHLREVIVSALEMRGRSFVPLSWRAFTRLDIPVENVTLVDRVGMECVFSGDGKYYISGYDHNEEPSLYFLARLPHAVATYDEAIEALKPESVKLAEAHGVKVLRQGDMFAIYTDYTDADLTEMGATLSDTYPLPPQSTHAEHGLYGTAHFTTTIARLPDGTTFGRGEMAHRPSGRRPDHAPLKLVPDSWYLIVKNTVPTIESERG